MGLNWSAISDMEDRVACRSQFNVSVVSLIVNILVCACTGFLVPVSYNTSFGAIGAYVPLTLLQLGLNGVIYTLNHPHEEARPLSAIHTFNAFVIFVLAIAGVIAFQKNLLDVVRDILFIPVLVLNFFQVSFFSFGCASVFNRSLFMRECYRLSAIAPVATIVGTQEQSAAGTSGMVTVVMSQDMLDAIQ